MIPAAFVAGLEVAFNRYLQLDPDIPPRLAALDGEVIAIGLDGLNQAFYLLPGIDGVRVMDRHEGKPSVWIRGTPLALLRQWRSGPAVDGDVTIEGDVTVGREFQAILMRMDIDWEEQLSKQSAMLLPINWAISGAVCAAGVDAAPIPSSAMGSSISSRNCAPCHHALWSSNFSARWTPCARTPTDSRRGSSACADALQPAIQCRSIFPRGTPSACSVPPSC